MVRVLWSITMEWYRAVGCVANAKTELSLEGRHFTETGVLSGVPHSIFQLATLSVDKFARNLLPGMKLDFTLATRLEKPDGDIGDENDMTLDEKIQLLQSLHIH